MDLNSKEIFIQQINECLPSERLLQWALNRLCLEKVFEREERGREIYLTNNTEKNATRIDQFKL